MGWILGKTNRSESIDTEVQEMRFRSWFGGAFTTFCPILAPLYQTITFLVYEN